MKFGGAMSKKSRYFLDKAIKLSRLSDYPQFKHGAVITKNGNVLGMGVNRMVNNPGSISDDEVAKKHASIHAEVAALKACGKANLTGATIYVARTSRIFSRPAMSKPCENCQEALREAGIKRVYYTIDSTMEL